MSKVRCHYCGIEIPLELARGRGVFPGFMCPGCYTKQVIRVGLWLPIGAVILVLVVLGVSAGIRSALPAGDGQGDSAMEKIREYNARELERRDQLRMDPCSRAGLSQEANRLPHPPEHR